MSIDRCVFAHVYIYISCLDGSKILFCRCVDHVLMEAKETAGNSALLHVDGYILRSFYQCCISVDVDMLSGVVGTNSLAHSNQ